MEVNWVLIAAAVLVVGLVLMNMQKSRFDDYGVTGDEYAPVDTFDSYGVTGDEYAPVDTYAEETYGEEAEDYAQYGEDEYAGDEAEAEDNDEEYAGDEAEEDDMAGDESDGEDEDDTDEVEEFTLMEPTIDDKYANALFTPPLL